MFAAYRRHARQAGETLHESRLEVEFARPRKRAQVEAPSGGGVAGGEGGVAKTDFYSGRVIGVACVERESQRLLEERCGAIESAGMTIQVTKARQRGVAPRCLA